VTAGLHSRDVPARLVFDGRFRYYRLRAKPLSEVDSWVSRYRSFMERQLDALGRVLDEMPDEPAEPKAPPGKRKRRKP
jgi:hypothetical protein